MERKWNEMEQKWNEMEQKWNEMERKWSETKLKWSEMKRDVPAFTEWPIHLYVAHVNVWRDPIHINGCQSSGPSTDTSQRTTWCSAWIPRGRWPSATFRNLLQPSEPSRAMLPLPSPSATFRTEPSHATFCHLLQPSETWTSLSTPNSTQLQCKKFKCKKPPLKNSFL